MARKSFCTLLECPRRVQRILCAPVAERLSQLLGQEVKMADDVIGEPPTVFSASELKDGEVMLLENVRFHKEE